MRAPHDVATDFRSSAWLDDPYADYAAWQRDTPVFRNQDGALYLTRHADCSALLGEARFRRRASAATRPFEASTPLDAMLGQWMLFMDPPRHEVVRDAFAPLFAPHALERTEAAIRATVRDLIAPLLECPRTEFVAAFASPLPVLVLCELLGLPPEDRPLFEDWSATLTRALESGAASEMQSAVPASRAMRDYFVVRRSPSLPQLTADETLFGLAFLVWAGHETTRNVLASGMLALCEHPGETQRWREHPGLARRAVEELLRFTTPVQKLSRWTSDAACFGEYEIPGGALVTALVGAGNRDPAMFEQPQRIDLARSPNPHLSFGRGLHACLGASLARLEAQIALPALLDAFGTIDLIGRRWRANSALRGLEWLELSLR
jgi:cytochrome P450